MERHEIKYFRAICRTRNFHRAAEPSQVSQPAFAALSTTSLGAGMDGADAALACADEVIAWREKASRVRLRQKRLLRCLGVKRRSVRSVGRAVGTKTRHCLHELRG